MARILVIDDNEIINEMLVQMLENAGYEAQGAENGNTGLKLLEKQPFDLIVTDIVMPDKEGLETIREIRGKSKSIPIIAISGGGKISPESYLTIAQKFGADYAFEKPIDRERFMRAVEECLTRRVESERGTEG